MQTEERSSRLKRFYGDKFRTKLGGEDERGPITKADAVSHTDGTAHVLVNYKTGHAEVHDHTDLAAAKKQVHELRK